MSETVHHQNHQCGSVASSIGNKIYPHDIVSVTEGATRSALGRDCGVRWLNLLVNSNVNRKRSLTFQFTDPGASSEVVTPVPIPNTAVKRLSADDTLVHSRGKVGQCPVQWIEMENSPIRRVFCYIQIIEAYFPVEAS